MKKFLLLFILISTATLTSCRVTKTFTLLNAKSASDQKETDFLQAKADRITFLKLSEEQKEKAITIWKTEKQELGNAHKKKNSEIASIIYKSEMDFRNILTEEQLSTYREKYKNLYQSGYMNDKQIEELVRIYKL
jgi:hypothetical protein